MNYLSIKRDRNNRIRRIRIGYEMGPKPSLIWDRDDDYDRPRFRIRLPFFRVSWYPGLRGPIRYTIAGNRGEVESWREYRRRFGYWIAGIDRKKQEEWINKYASRLRGEQ